LGLVRRAWTDVWAGADRLRADGGTADPATTQGDADTASTTQDSGGPPTNAAPVGSLRDVRYCEVIPSVTQGSLTTTYVYNTLTFSFCPPQQWNALTEDEVKQEFSSQNTQLNGPRHWSISSPPPWQLVPEAVGLTR
jgi:hypothetical protein